MADGDDTEELETLGPKLQPLESPQKEKIGLCLSGGGYRAMLFHLGALIRMNELGLLPKIDRISAVSGGSIVAGVLASNWNGLTFENDIATNFDDLVTKKVIDISKKVIDIPAGISGFLMLLPSAFTIVRNRYKKYFAGNMKLKDLPEKPDFVFCSTNLSTGSPFYFSRAGCIDWRLKHRKLAWTKELDLATAVASSSAFPPVLSPARLNLVGPGGDRSEIGWENLAVLTDGGVYDNLGLQPMKRFSTILVSNGGAPFRPSADKYWFWLFQSRRVVSEIQLQVENLRLADLLASFKKPRTAGGRDGTRWRIGSAPDDPKAPLRMPFDKQKAEDAANAGTWLHYLGAELSADIVNWGYVLADARIEQWYIAGTTAPTKFPVRGDQFKASFWARIVARFFH